MSSAVLATTVRSSHTPARPRASMAPPVPPDRSTTESIAGSLPGGPMRLADRTALVTGGASGIGAATCRRLAAEGARVAVTDVNLEGARGVAAEVDGAAFELDVRFSDSVRAAVEGAESELGPVDVLVNNAGYDEWNWFTATDEALWRRVLEVNLVGVIACTHAVLPGMQERRRGRIVNV